MPIRRFTRKELGAIGVPFECDDDPVAGHATELRREEVEKRRWVSMHELVFRAPDDGKAYRVEYAEALTEIQDGTDPWWYEGDGIDAVEVEPRKRMVEITEWLPVAD